MVFSCPPYAFLEKYSNHEDDLSNMKYEDFIIKYNSIIKKSCNLLNEKSFAIFVVGEVRDKKGWYLDFVGDTKKAFMNCGLKFHSEIILKNNIGSACIRIPGVFDRNRKITKVHQNILIFYKE